MDKILDRLKAGEVLVCDGAMGTFLQAKGLEPGTCPELWCLERADAVRDIHAQYRAAGSDIVETNSFGGTRYKLQLYGLAAQTVEINRAAAALAREVAGDSQYVLGSVGPTGEFMAPLGSETEADFYAAFSEQVIALEQGGADLVIIESMTAVEEAAAAVRAAKENTALTVIVSFTFDPRIDGGYASMMGVTPARFAAELTAAGADIIGTNCGTGPDHMIEVVRLLRAAAAPEIPVLAMPNAGMPELENGVTVFRATPAEVGAKARALVAAGAGIVGGCCGTGPAHIAAICQAVRSRAGRPGPAGPDAQ